MALKIAILDSGLSQHYALPQIAINQRKHFILDQDGNILENEEISDQYGHGTAVTFLIAQGCLKRKLDIEISVFRLFNGEETDEKILLYALDKLLSEKVDIIHISAGITCYTNNDLYEVCFEHQKRGTLIISAFDNLGSVSYPAAFPFVVGVDGSALCRRTEEYVYIESGVVNILGFGSKQRLPWINQTWEYVSGSSFAAPYITVLAGEFKTLNPQLGVREFLDFLRKKAKYCKNFQSTVCKLPETFLPHKALIFPYNKEQQTLIHYRNMLKFEIQIVADCKETGLVGKNGIDFLIQNIDKVDWTLSFDTVILGHTKLLSQLVGRDWISEIFCKCLKWKKNLFSYDDLSDYRKEIQEMRKNGLKVYWNSLVPEVDKEYYMNKLFQLSVPTVAVVGTGSKQGKFTLQLQFKNFMEKLGYKVGFLSSEPNGELFGAHKVIPFGYGSAENIHEKEFIMAVNYALHEIELKNRPDLLLMGSQSHTVPLSMGNLGFYPVYQHGFILAGDPDAFILCIGPDDDITYIQRTIKYLDSVVYGKTLALVFFPFRNEAPSSTLATHLTRITEDEAIETIENLRKESLLPVYCPNIFDKDIEKLCEEIIDFF